MKLGELLEAIEDYSIIKVIPPNVTPTVIAATSRAEFMKRTEYNADKDCNIRFAEVKKVRATKSRKAGVHLTIWLGK